MITVNCPQCKKLYNVGDEFNGKRVQCKKCSTAFTIGLELLPEDNKPEIPISQTTSVPSKQKPGVQTGIKKSYTDYANVPWYRKDNAVSLMTFATIPLAIGLSLFGSIAVPLVIFPWAACIINLSGSVYTKKKTDSGNLKTWGAGNKIAAVIVLIFTIVLVFVHVF